MPIQSGPRRGTGIVETPRKKLRRSRQWQGRTEEQARALFAEIDAEIDAEIAADEAGAQDAYEDEWEDEDPQPVVKRRRPREISDEKLDALLDGEEWTPSPEERRQRRRGRAVLEQCLATRLARLARELRRNCARALRPYGLTASQFALLAAIISAGEPVRSRVVARQLSLSESAVSRAVRRLFAGGFLNVALAENLASPALVVSSVGDRAFRRAFPAWKAVQGALREQLVAALALADEDVPDEED